MEKSAFPSLHGTRVLWLKRGRRVSQPTRKSAPPPRRSYGPTDKWSFRQRGWRRPWAQKISKEHAPHDTFVISPHCDGRSFFEYIFEFIFVRDEATCKSCNGRSVRPSVSLLRAIRPTRSTSTHGVVKYICKYPHSMNTFFSTGLLLLLLLLLPDQSTDLPLHICARSYS